MKVAQKLNPSTDATVTIMKSFAITLSEIFSFGFSQILFYLEALAEWVGQFQSFEWQQDVVKTLWKIMYPSYLPISYQSVAKKLSFCFGWMTCLTQADANYFDDDGDFDWSLLHFNCQLPHLCREGLAFASLFWREPQ